MLAVFEILREFCISIYCVSALSLHIESTNSMIQLLLFKRALFKVGISGMAK